MKEELINNIKTSFASAFGLEESGMPDIIIEIPKRGEHGDFSTSAAMIYASLNKLKPRDVAEKIVANLPASRIWEKVEIAGPGFINFYMTTQYWHQIIIDAYNAGQDYGRSNLGKGEKVQVEFVSANPTGPLHIGHGRGAAIGDSLSRILKFAGYNVQNEYYVNDTGNQITILGRSIRARLNEQAGSGALFPEEMQDLYKGEYVKELAVNLSNEKSTAILLNMDDKELGRLGSALMLEDIKTDLSSFGINFDIWFSEYSLYQKKDGQLSPVEDALNTLKEKGYVYESEGALWVSTTPLGDDKDRVVVKNNGETTYFASDIAYHKDKLDRGFSKIINIWGADHHGYIPRMNAVCEMLGYKKETLSILIVQLVHLFRGGKQIVMSKRGGEFVTLREVIEEAGKDASRFFFLMRKADASLDFDLDLAKKQSNENPVFYVQYAHARLSSVHAKAVESSLTLPEIQKINIDMLNLPEEINIIKQLSIFPNTVNLAAKKMEPHRLTFYLMELAGHLHSYYFKYRIITDDKELSLARLALMKCVKHTIKNGLELIGVTAPENM